MMKRNQMEIRFTQEVFEKIEMLVKNCPIEIMGLGKVEITPYGNVRVTDVAVIEQEATSAHTEFDKDKLMEFFSDRIKEGDSAEWKLWWHSHATMGCFWSGTDTGNIANLGETADWAASVVFNHKMECLGRVDQFQPLPMKDENITIIKETETNVELLEWAKKEIADKVKEPPKIEQKKILYSSQTSEYVDDEEEERAAWAKYEQAKKDGELMDEADTAIMDDIADKISLLEPLSKYERKFVNNHKDWFDQTEVVNYYRAMAKGKK